MSESDTLPIIKAYRSPVIRLYSLIRFFIIRQRFLDEIGQYLPTKGTVLDIGCGFGLFSLYFAKRFPQTQFVGLDYNSRRIEKAKRAAGRLNLDNVEYGIGDARTLTIDQSFDAAYMLDIIHHIPPEAVKPLIQTMFDRLASDGRLIVKDVADKPFYKRWFTWWLDKVMDVKTPVHYWSIESLNSLLQEVGFKVYVHQMVDFLPYPHVIYICQKPG